MRETLKRLVEADALDIRGELEVFVPELLPQTDADLLDFVARNEGKKFYRVQQKHPGMAIRGGCFIASPSLSAVEKEVYSWPGAVKGKAHRGWNYEITISEVDLYHMYLVRREAAEGNLALDKAERGPG